MAENPTTAPPAAQPTAALHTANSPTEAHCPYRQASLLQQALEPDKMRVGLFLGAGCPVAIRVPDDAWTKPLIPDVAGLTAQVRGLLESSVVHKTTLGAVIKRLTEGGGPEPNIEAILSRVRGLRDVIRGGTLDGLSEKTLGELEAEIYELTNKSSRYDCHLRTPHTIESPLGSGGLSELIPSRFSRRTMTCSWSRP